jgi:acid phosphatase (class A)
MLSRTLLFVLNFFYSTILCYSQSLFGIRAEDPPKAHYAELALLDQSPDPAFAWMDTITYPRKDVATSTLAVTMWRTAYLIDDVPELLAIDPPPANSSDQTRKELEFLLKLQGSRTDKDISRYRTLAGIYHSPNNINPLDPDYDRNYSSLFHIGRSLGSWYTYKDLPVTAKFLSNVYRDAMYYVFKMKVAFNRPRPYHLEPKLAALEKPHHQSYPSGHSSGSFANAFIIMEIAPELTDEFIEAAEEMAISREYLGCHYPSDSEMGRLWARKFVNELFRKDKFLADFEAAKREILEAKKKHTVTSKKEHPSEVVGATNKPMGNNSVCSSSGMGTCNKSCCKNSP